MENILIPDDRYKRNLKIAITVLLVLVMMASTVSLASQPDRLHGVIGSISQFSAGLSEAGFVLRDRDRTWQAILLPCWVAEGAWAGLFNEIAP
jgi:hypothetical protein